MSIHVLPLHLLQYLFSFLDHKSLLCASQTCRSWNRAANSDELWRAFLTQTFRHWWAGEATSIVIAKDYGVIRLKDIFFLLRPSNLSVRDPDMYKNFPISPLRHSSLSIANLFRLYRCYFNRNQRAGLSGLVNHMFPSHLPRAKWGRITSSFERLVRVAVRVVPFMALGLFAASLYIFLWSQHRVDASSLLRPVIATIIAIPYGALAACCVPVSPKAAFFAHFATIFFCRKMLLRFAYLRLISGITLPFWAKKVGLGDPWPSSWWRRLHVISIGVWPEMVIAALAGALSAATVRDQLCLFIDDTPGVLLGNFRVGGAR